MDIIIVNGAPFTGKDTLVSQLLKVIDNSYYIRFKNPLYKRFSEIHNIPFDEVVSLCTGAQKDEPNDRIGGLIPRQVLIDISENEIKVKDGEAGVALRVIEEILEVEQFNRKTFIFPDGGFEVEKKTLERILKLYGLQRTILVRLTRNGFTFEAKRDSRSLLQNPDIILTNDTDESNLPVEERGKVMCAKFMDFYTRL